MSSVHSASPIANEKSPSWVRRQHSTQQPICLQYPPPPSPGIIKEVLASAQRVGSGGRAVRGHGQLYTHVHDSSSAPNSSIVGGGQEASVSLQNHLPCSHFSPLARRCRSQLHTAAFGSCSSQGSDSLRDLGIVGLRHTAYLGLPALGLRQGALGPELFMRP